MGLPALAGIGIGSQVLGTIFGAVGAGQAGSAQAANAEYAAQVARNNAVIADQNAAAALQAGEAKTTAVGLRNQARMGSRLASQSARGVDVNIGSPVDVRASERMIGQLDAETTLHNAQLQSYGYRAQGTNFEAQAGLDTARAGQARAAGGLGVASSLISGAGGLVNRFSWMQQNSDFFGGGGSGLGPGEGDWSSADGPF